MRVCTFNVFWLGTPSSLHIRRDADDEAALAAVLRHLDADVLVFQEVVSLPLLASLLARAASAPGPSGTARDYALHDAQGRWLTTGRMRSRISHSQKIALAYDRSSLELREPIKLFQPRGHPGPRLPIAARFRHRASRFELLTVGVHLKSGEPAEPADCRPSLVRAAECEAIALALDAREHARVQKPGLAADEAVVLLGDFNALRAHPSLDPLRVRLPHYTWHEPRFPDEVKERWTGFTTRSVIDHVLTSPAATARVTRPPGVYAFDLDPALDRPNAAPRSPIHFLRRKTDLVIQPGEGEPPHLIENLYRISDHRPLFIDLSI